MAGAADFITFEFDCGKYKTKAELTPADPDLRENISFSGLNCGCCWSISMPVKYEYEYRCWMDEHNIQPTTANYFNRTLLATRSYLTIESMITKYKKIKSEFQSGELAGSAVLERD